MSIFEVTRNLSFPAKDVSIINMRLRGSRRDKELRRRSADP